MKTGFDNYFEEQMKSPAFREAYEKARKEQKKNLLACDAQR